MKFPIEAKLKKTIKAKCKYLYLEEKLPMSELREFIKEEYGQKLSLIELSEWIDVWKEEAKKDSAEYIEKKRKKEDTYKDTLEQTEEVISHVLDSLRATPTGSLVMGFVKLSELRLKLVELEDDSHGEEITTIIANINNVTVGKDDDDKETKVIDVEQK